MSQFITVPINANGIVFDSDMDGVVQEAMEFDPFEFSDIFVYSHGWGNDASAALDEYNRFSIDLSKRILQLAKSAAAQLTRLPRQTLGIGIHWPSEITEDSGSILNKLQLLTFYTMEHRADAVGRNAVYVMLRLILGSRSAGNPPIRISLLGHSFGCKVVLAALDQIQKDVEAGSVIVQPGTTFQAVLMEPATDDDHLEAAGIYACVEKLNVRLLITKSNLDYALTRWFVDAGQIVNLLRKPRRALGDTGPTPATIAYYGGADQVDVDTNFTFDKVPAGKRMVIADLSKVHQARVDTKAYVPGFAGSHSDINFKQIYELVCGFLFR